MEIMMVVKMMVMMIRTLFLSTNYVLVIALSTEDTKFTKAALLVCL